METNLNEELKVMQDFREMSGRPTLLMRAAVTLER